MNNTCRIFTFSVFFQLSLPAFSQTKALSFFEGTWDFKIWFTNNTSESPDLSALWILETGLENTECYIGRVEISGSVFTREIISLNSMDNEYVRTINANNGAYLVLKTKGWEGDTLIWTGTQYLSGQQTVLKEEIIKQGQNEFKATFFNLTNDNWVQTQTEVLTRKIK